MSWECRGLVPICPVYAGSLGFPIWFESFWGRFSTPVLNWRFPCSDGGFPYLPTPANTAGYSPKQCRMSWKCRAVSGHEKGAPTGHVASRGKPLVNAFNRFLDFLYRLLHIRRWWFRSRAYPDSDFVECV